MRSHRMLKICAFSLIYAGGVSLNSKEKGARKYLWPYYQVANILENVAIARPSLELFNNFITVNFLSLSSVASSPSVSREGFQDLEGGAYKKDMKLPEIVKVGDPILREHAQEVDPNEIRSERVQNIIDYMICVTREANGVGLAAPHIGIPLRIIVLEYKKAYTSYATKEGIKPQERRPFDQLVILNPKLEKKSNKTAKFQEICLRATVERCRDVEVTGLDQNGDPIIVTASSWQARVLQHECDHLDGILCVDKMVPGIFRTVKNWFRL